MSSALLPLHQSWGLPEVHRAACLLPSLVDLSVNTLSPPAHPITPLHGAFSESARLLPDKEQAAGSSDCHLGVLLEVTRRLPCSITSPKHTQELSNGSGGERGRRFPGDGPALTRDMQLERGWGQEKDQVTPPTQHHTSLVPRVLQRSTASHRPGQPGSHRPPAAAPGGHKIKDITRTDPPHPSGPPTSCQESQLEQTRPSLLPSPPLGAVLTSLKLLQVTPCWPPTHAHPGP